MCHECKKNKTYKLDLCESCYAEMFKPTRRFGNWINSTDAEFCSIDGQYSCMTCHAVSDPFAGCECEQKRLFDSLRHMNIAYRNRRIKLEGFDEKA